MSHSKLAFSGNTVNTTGISPLNRFGVGLLEIKCCTTYISMRTMQYTKTHKKEITCFANLTNCANDSCGSIIRREHHNVRSEQSTHSVSKTQSGAGSKTLNLIMRLNACMLMSCVLKSECVCVAPQQLSQPLPVAKVRPPPPVDGLMRIAHNSNHRLVHCTISIR